MRSDGKMERVDAEMTAPVVVRNADIPLLSDVFYIMQEVCAVERRRDWQRERMYKITSNASGMPGGGGVRGLDDAFARLAEIDEEHEKSCKEYVATLKKAEEILNGIQSQSMRTFVLMKYVMNAPDVEIRSELNMSRRGFERARRCIEGAENMAAVRWQERFTLKK